MVSLDEYVGLWVNRWIVLEAPRLESSSAIKIYFNNKTEHNIIIISNNKFLHARCMNF